MKTVVPKLFNEFLSNRFITPSLFTSIMVFIITFIALFIPPYIGIADNGNFFSIAYSNGLYFSNPHYDDYYFGHFVKDYGIFQYYNENKSILFSSQSLFIKLSIFLNVLLYNNEVYDIRFQSFIYIILYVIALYLLMEALTWKMNKKSAYLLSAIAIFIFADTGYTAYFNSFYSESVILISLLFFVASALLIYRNRYNRYALIVLFTISAIVLTTSKEQNALLAIIIALIGSIFYLINKYRPYRLFIIFCMLLISFTGVISHISISDEAEKVNKFHAMTRGVLLSTNNPEAAIESFDIDKQFSVLTNELYYFPLTKIDIHSDLLNEEFYKKYSFSSIFLYYLTHPNQAIEMLNLAAKNGFTIRPPGMGNFEATANKTFGQQTFFFTSYSWMKNQLIPKTFGFIVIWIVIVIGINISSFLVSIKSNEKISIIRFPFILSLIILAISSMIIMIVNFGDVDLSKHLFLFSAIFDVITLISIVTLFDKHINHTSEIINENINENKLKGILM